uniref:Endostatin domain-containing protein n=1 Tax=Globodera rostochiensis TaxID=31243 RepID=A0A914IB95_GLORO
MFLPLLLLSSVFTPPAIALSSAASANDASSSPSPLMPSTPEWQSVPDDPTLAQELEREEEGSGVEVIAAAVGDTETTNWVRVVPTEVPDDEDKVETKDEELLEVEQNETEMEAANGQKGTNSKGAGGEEELTGQVNDVQRVGAVHPPQQHQQQQIVRTETTITEIKTVVREKNDGNQSTNEEGTERQQSVLKTGQNEVKTGQSVDKTEQNVTRTKESVSDVKLDEDSGQFVPFFEEADVDDDDDDDDEEIMENESLLQHEVNITRDETTKTPEVEEKPHIRKEEVGAVHPPQYQHQQIVRTKTITEIRTVVEQKNIVDQSDQLIKTGQNVTKTEMNNVLEANLHENFIKTGQNTNKTGTADVSGHPPHQQQQQIVRTEETMVERRKTVVGMGKNVGNQSVIEEETKRRQNVIKTGQNTIKTEQSVSEVKLDENGERFTQIVNKAGDGLSNLNLTMLEVNISNYGTNKTTQVGGKVEERQHTRKEDVGAVHPPQHQQKIVRTETIVERKTVVGMAKDVDNQSVIEEETKRRQSLIKTGQNVTRMEQSVSADARREEEETKRRQNVTKTGQNVTVIKTGQNVTKTEEQSGMSADARREEEETKRRQSVIKTGQNVTVIKTGGAKGAAEFGRNASKIGLHDDPSEAANQCNENWWKTRRRDFSHHKDTERDGGAGGEGSGFGGPSFDNDDAGGGERSMPTTERPLMSTTSTTATYTTMAPPTTATTAAMATRAETRPSAADRWDGALSGPQGQKGEPGVPGTCASECRMPPPGPPGLPGAPGVSGLPGVFTGLSDADVRRIVKWPDVKGEKGTCMERHSDRGAGTDSMARHNQRREEGENENALELLMNGQSGDIAGLPPYDSRIHGDGQQQPRVGQKGDKGDRGVAGTAGAPGPPGPPGPVPRQQQQQQQQQMPQSPVAATVSVYQTALELLAGTPKCPIGTLAFAISTQQLFLRVHSGWRQVLLDPTILNDRQPPLTPPQQRQPLPPPAPQFRHRPATQSELLEQQQQQPTEDPALSRLAYWLALDEPSGAREDEESESAPAASRGRGPEGPEGAEGALVPIGRPPLLPPTAPPAPPRSIPQAQPWRTAQLPPKGWKSSREEETEKPSIRHKDKVIHLMALNEPLLGNFGGVRGADLECYRQARQAGFSTTFRAFISSRVQDLNKIVHAEDRQQTPVVNLLGERLFDSWHGVFDGGAHAHVPLYTFDRRNVFNHRDWSDRWVWHGSSSGGLRSLAYCADWRSTKLNTFGMASPLHSRHALTDQSREMPCNRRFAVLCVEVMSKHSVHQKLGKRFMSDLRV